MWVVIPALVLALGTTPALARSPLPRVLTDGSGGGTTFVVKPQLIIYSADGGFAFGRLRGGAHHSWIHWTTYTQTRARAVGTVDINTCKPDCASDNRITKRGTLTLSHPVLGRFTRDVLAYGHTVTRGQLLPWSETANGGVTWAWGPLRPAQDLAGNHSLPFSGETVKAQPGIYAIDYYARPNGTPIDTIYASFTPATSTSTTVPGPAIRITDPLTTDKVGNLLSTNPSPSGPLLFQVSYSHGVWTFLPAQTNVLAKETS